MRKLFYALAYYLNYFHLILAFIIFPSPVFTDFKTLLQKGFYTDSAWRLGVANHNHYNC